MTCVIQMICVHIRNCIKHYMPIWLRLKWPQDIRVWGENYFIPVGQIFCGFASDWTLRVSGVREDNLFNCPHSSSFFSPVCRLKASQEPNTSPKDGGVFKGIFVQWMFSCVWKCERKPTFSKTICLGYRFCLLVSLNLVLFDIFLWVKVYNDTLRVLLSSGTWLCCYAFSPPPYESNILASFMGTMGGLQPTQ